MRTKTRSRSSETLSSGFDSQTQHLPDNKNNRSADAKPHLKKEKKNGAHEFRGKSTNRYILFSIQAHI